MKEIILVGGGGHCKSVIDVIENEGKFKIAGIVDKSELLNTKVFKYKVIGSDKDLEILAKKYKYAFIAVGQIKSPEIRIRLYNRVIKAGFTIPTIISPNAYVSKYSVIKKGTIVMHNAIINANTKIGLNCIINSRVLIEHDCLIKNHCHISTGAIINGGTSIDSGCFIGSNCTTKNLIRIKKNSFYKAGSLIV